MQKDALEWQEAGDIARESFMVTSATTLLRKCPDARNSGAATIGHSCNNRAATIFETPHTSTLLVVYCMTHANIPTQLFIVKSPPSRQLARICVCLCVYIYIYVCVCVYIYICVCVYIYIYIYIYICIFVCSVCHHHLSFFKQPARAHTHFLLLEQNT